MLSTISYLILPLLFSGIVHHFIVIKYDLFKFLKVPVDFGATFSGQRIFGDSKTFRGLIAVVVLTGIFMYLLSFLYPSIQLAVSPFIAGSLLGLGYSLGELPTSFFKRKFGIPQGEQSTGLKGVFFYALEQIDSVVGALIVAQFLLSVTLLTNLYLFVIGSFLHLSLDLVLYFRGYKKGLNKPFYLK